MRGKIWIVSTLGVGTTFHLSKGRSSESHRRPAECLHELVIAINLYRKLSESQPLTLQGSDYAHAVLELNKAIDHAEALLLQ
jgi:hypothetical protein